MSGSVKVFRQKKHLVNYMAWWPNWPHLGCFLWTKGVLTERDLRSWCATSVRLLKEFFQGWIWGNLFKSMSNKSISVKFFGKIIRKKFLHLILWPPFYHAIFIHNYGQPLLLCRAGQNVLSSKVHWGKRRKKDQKLLTKDSRKCLETFEGTICL